MAITIYHNPGCGTSRTVLAALRDGGHAPQVVEYLKAGWTEAQLKDLFGEMGVTPRQMLRTRGDLVEELGLTDPGVGDAAILKAMVAHPVLVERPIVVTPKGVFLCRPADRLADAL
ncbi:MAG TPA: arsenate reductase (glutaredoxin) [Caulobacteraceae bacterium]|jgi:arsenate reductase|nr:arsenate reductase (glutaredoxin) [Caulobacteraceae bacterium]